MELKKYKKFILPILLLIIIFLAAFFVLKKNKDNNTQTTNGSKNKKQTEAAISMLSKTPIKTPFEMPEIPEVSFPDRVCDISGYGAVGDGKTMNTKAFSDAISDCEKNGGGKVEVPQGVWLTGPIHLENNIDLDIEKGATIKFSTNPKDYLPAVFTRYEGIEFYGYSPFIYAENAENIAITGEGEIDGQGGAWSAWNDTPEIPVENSAPEAEPSPKDISVNKLYSLAESGTPVEKRVFGDDQDFIQPSFVQFANCDKILIDGVKIENSPSWTIHPIYSSNMIIRNTEVKTSERNTDGVVIDSSSNILVYNSTFDTGDDAISIKSGKDADGWRVGKPSENIVIHDVKVEDGHSGIAIGSEMSGDIRNVLAYNLSIAYADNPISLKSMAGRGGTVENIWIEDVDIQRAVQSAILVDMQYGTPPAGYDKNKPPVFRNIDLENIYCRRARNAATFNGLPESPLENITLSNAKISATNDIITENVESKNFKNVEITTGD